MGNRIAHALVVLAGIAVLGWGIALAANPTASCRGVDMGPGDTCYYASPLEAKTERVQTYEQRIATVRSNSPVVMGLGAVIAGFGSVLLVQDARSRRQPPRSDIGP